MRTKRARVRRRKHGGRNEVPGVPDATIIAQFAMNDQTVASYNSVCHLKTDCGINVFQLLGLIDAKTANLMRITDAGEKGMTLEQIEKIFTLYTGHNMTFLFGAADIGRLIDIAIGVLPPGKAMVVFMRTMERTTEGHVVLIAKAANGEPLMIDPQLTTSISNIQSPGALEILGKWDVFEILYVSPAKLKDDQLRLLGFSI
jgi:hypothetical protein